MYNNNSSNHAVSARLYSVKGYNRATDAEVARILLANYRNFAEWHIIIQLGFNNICR